jgi:CrcB protein
VTDRPNLSTSITGRRRFAVAAGGALGAVGRALVTDIVGGSDFDILWATFVVNIVGSIVLGYVVTRHSGRSRSSPFLIPFVGVGVLGAFTTFSLFSAEVFELARAGDWVWAVAYPLLSISAGFVAALLGIRFGGSK